jgi:hypothetical protein
MIVEKPEKAPAFDVAIIGAGQACYYVREKFRNRRSTP